MNITLTLLDDWKREKNIPSDNQAAIRLGLGRAAISRWRNTGTEAEDATIVKIAKELHRDPDPYILAIATKRAATPELKAVLTKLAKAIGHLALVTLLFCLPHIAEAKSVQIHNVENAQFDINATFYTFTINRRRNNRLARFMPQDMPCWTTSAAAGYRRKCWAVTALILCNQRRHSCASFSFFADKFVQRSLRCTVGLLNGL